MPTTTFQPLHFREPCLSPCPTVDLGITPTPYFRWKSRFERICACLLLIPALAVIAALIVLVRLTSRGPGIYRQTRVGHRGKIFVALKIRTMREHAESDSGPVWSEPGDPRVTFLGRVLRAMHLDELPQLINVVRGDMVLIGPRPERPEFVRKLAHEVEGYLDRLEVPPGLTGLAQINLASDCDVEHVRRKLVLDLEYIRSADLWLDSRISACTLVRLLGYRGLGLARLLGICHTLNAEPEASLPPQEAEA